MPSLADIYSTIDSYKRKLGDVVGNPIGSIKQAIGNANDQARDLNDLTYQSALERHYGPKTRELAEKIANSYGPEGMTLWHGSPHLLNKFDLSKIGTGEGTQAYGHGIYLAEHPEVAKSYSPRDPIFEKKVLAKYNAAEKQENYPAMEVYEAYLTHSTPEEIEKQLEEMSGKDLVSAKKALNSAKPLYQNQSSSLYKVDVPDKHIERMLDWEKPLSEQHPDVQKVLAKFEPDTYDPKGYDYDPNEMGQQTYHRLAGILNVRNPGPASAETKASQFLSENGIPGLRYLDEGSRGYGKGTSNFVLFDPSIATVTERNSAPIAQPDIHSEVADARAKAIANPNDTNLWNSYMSLRKQRDEMTSTNE
jgi:hypothetical protein